MPHKEKEDVAQKEEARDGRDGVEEGRRRVGINDVGAGDVFARRRREARLHGNGRREGERRPDSPLCEPLAGREATGAAEVPRKRNERDAADKADRRAPLLGKGPRGDALDASGRCVGTSKERDPRRHDAELWRQRQRREALQQHDALHVVEKSGGLEAVVGKGRHRSLYRGSE